MTVFGAYGLFEGYVGLRGFDLPLTRLHGVLHKTFCAKDYNEVDRLRSDVESYLQSQHLPNMAKASFDVGATGSALLMGAGIGLLAGDKTKASSSLALASSVLTMDSAFAGICGWAPFSALLEFFAINVIFMAFQ